MEGEEKKGRIQYKGHGSVLFSLNGGEAKGTNVSEGLIGSDTIEKLSGLLPALSSITYKECRNVEAGWVIWEREEEKSSMIETFGFHFLLTESHAEK